MMKNTITTRVISVLLLAAMLFALVACGTPPDETPTHVDYASEVKLDMNSDTFKLEVDVHIYIDGDTTHFNVPTSVMEDGVIKARYLAINTPESTGRVEAWGKKASDFTKERLKNATSIIIESDDDKLNADSTGNRYMLWIWYKTEESEDYRNLNIEILQNGLAIASNSAQNRYGETCMKAIDQAKAEKLNVYSPDKDPDFHYGAADEMTLKQLRTHISEYEQKKVAFEGVISAIYDGSFYVEEYDAETGMSYGVSVYYQTAGLAYPATTFIELGNRVRVVAVVSYFEGGDIWQVSGLTYSIMKPNDPSNFQLISQGHTPAYTLTSASDFVNKKVPVVITTTNEDGEEIETEKIFDYAELALDTSISMNDLYVTKSYTNKNGEVTLTCTSGGVTIKLFLGLMYDDAGKPVSDNTFTGKTINVKGLVDKYYENYQIRVLTYEDIVVQ